jgi:translocation protein SEC63
MSNSYKYDESGLASSYLALSIMAPITLYCTYKAVAFGRHRGIRCFCKGCKGKKLRAHVVRKIAVALLWVLLAYLVRNILNIKTESNQGFDPLTILGIEADADANSISRRFKKLYARYTQRKKRPELREEYEEKIKELSRAYNTVKDRKMFERWLNFDSKTGEIMAIPEVVIRQGAVAFIIYCLVLGIVLPKWAYSKWRNIRDNNKAGVSFRSMETFYDRLGKEYDQQESQEELTDQLIMLLCRSEEFSSHPWKSNVEGLKAKIEQNFAHPVNEAKSTNKGYLVLMDHLFRLGQADAEDVDYAQRVSLLLLQGIKAIAEAKKYASVTKALLVLEAMIVQAVFNPKYFMLQIPSIGFEDLFLQEENGVKIEPTEDSLRGVLQGRELDSALAVLKHIPRIEVAQFSASYVNTGIDTEEDDVREEGEADLVTRTDTKGKSDSTVYLLPKETVATIRVCLKKLPNNSILGGTTGLIAHAPYLKTNVYPKWSVMLTVGDVIHDKVVVLEDFPDARDLEFKLNTSSSSCSRECRIYVGCGEYLNNNLERSIVIKTE